VELDVVEMEEQDVAGEVLFTFAIPVGWAGLFVEEEDDEGFSVSGASGSGVHEGPPHRSACQDFPLVMAMAAERVGLPPPPLSPKSVSRLRQGFYGPKAPVAGMAGIHRVQGLRVPACC